MNKPVLDIVFLDRSEQRIDVYLAPAGDVVPADSVEDSGDLR